MDFTIRVHLHHKSLLAAGIAVLAFALPIIGVPKNVAWALIALGLALSVLAVFVWFQERKSAVPEEPPPVNKAHAVSEARRIASPARHQGKPERSRLALAAAGGPAVPLIRRGETLLGEVKELRKPVDPHTAQYEPQAVMFKQMSRASRYMLGATNPANTWLADVARFVSEEAPARSAELYPEPVKSLKTEQAAIEQNLGVLREIANGVLNPPVSESRAATILRAKHETAVLSAYQDILRTGQALRDDLGASVKGDQPATPELHSRAEAWFKRCGDWVSANLTAEQRARLGFDGAPRDSTTVAFYFGLTQRYVSALESAFRELF